jgi:hypothetical protein
MPPALLPTRAKVPASALPCVRAREDLRPVRPVIHVPGFTGYERLAAAIPGGVSRGMCAACQEAGGRLRSATRDAYLQVFYGSDWRR